MDSLVGRLTCLLTLEHDVDKSVYFQPLWIFTMSQLADSDARARLLQAATTLFYQRGIPNVGINEVIDSAGVAKRTLYKHFATKDELVLAVLTELAARREAAINAAIDAAETPVDAILAVFRLALDARQRPGFRGCAAINAALETAAPETAVHQFSREFKQRLRQRLADLARTAKLQKPDQLGWQLLLLWDGALVEAYIQQSAVPITAALAAAETLLTRTAN